MTLSSPSNSKPAGGAPLLISADQSPRSDWLWLALVVLAGFIVRLLASRGDLWLDEIMSVNIARSLHSPLDILLSPDAHRDNNHPINTLWLWLVQSRDSFMLDRALSVLAGTASIALAWVFARRWGRAPGFIAAILFAGSFFMINYGSEARGYAMLVMFMLLAMIALDRGMTRLTWLRAATFWIACILGMLSQLAFIHAFMAVGVWIAWRMVTRRSESLRTARTAVVFFAPPTLFIGWLFFVFIMGLKVSGANISSTLTILSYAAANTLGAPEEQQALAIGSLGVVIVLLACAIGLLIRRCDDSWILLMALVIVAPAVCMIVLQPPFLLARYFIVSITTMLLVIGLLLGALWQRGSVGRIATAGLIIVFLVVNTVNTSSLLQYGRGQYLQAMQDLAQRSASAPILIAGDHDFRESTIVNFYAPMIRGRSIEYVPQDLMTEAGADFAVFHSFDLQADPPASEIAGRHGHRYVLIGTYATGPFSGWYWFVYQRAK